MQRGIRLGLAAVLIVGALTGCTTYRNQLGHAQRAFEDNQHERALAILRDLERDVSHLDPTARAQYAYLRGMTDYRIGYQAEARHWLALARVGEVQNPGSLPDEWGRQLSEALGKLNEEVFISGPNSLSNTVRRADESAGDQPVAPPPLTPIQDAAALSNDAAAVETETNR